MSKMQKAIEVPDFIDIVDFLGPKDRFLDTVKRYYDVQMKFDNKELRVFGEEEEVLKATSVLSRILEMLESGESVLEKDVDLFSRQEREDKLDDVPNDIIFKIGKTTVKAKTKHQIEYANAIQDNTITFAIGPAGTAKTYLAATLAAKSLKEKKAEKKADDKKAESKKDEEKKDEPKAKLKPRVADKTPDWNEPVVW